MRYAQIVCYTPWFRVGHESSSENRFRIYLVNLWILESTNSFYTAFLQFGGGGSFHKKSQAEIIRKFLTFGRKLKKNYIIVNIFQIHAD